MNWSKGNILAKCYTISLLLIAITLPTRFIQLNSVCIIIMCCVCLLEKGCIYRIRRLFKIKAFFSIVSVFFVYIISLGLTDNLASGFSSIETRFSVFFIPVFVLSRPAIEQKQKHQILLGFLIMCIATSALCLISTFYFNYKSGIELSNATSWNFSSYPLIEKFGFHPSYFSIYCSFSLFILLYFLKMGSSGKIVKILLVVYLFIFQFFLASRVGILSFLVVITLTIIYETVIRKVAWLGVILILIFFSISFIGINSFGTMREKMHAMFNYKVDIFNKAFKLDARFSEWEASTTVIKNNLILGVGIGDQKDELQKIYYKKGFTEGFEERYDSHNLFIDTAVTAGLIGLFSLLFLFYYSLHVAIGGRNVLFIQFLILFILLSFVEASFSVQKGVVFFVFFNTLFLSKSIGIFNLLKKNYIFLKNNEQ
jgi:O-antigen ligase